MTIQLFQTVAGQHLIGRLVKDDAQLLHIEGCCMVVQQQRGVALAPMAENPKDAVPIYVHALMRPPFEAPKELADYWRSATSGIDLTTKPSGLQLVKP